MDDSGLFVPNGVSGISGRYAFPALDERSLAQYAVDNQLPPDAARYLGRVHQARTAPTLAMAAGVVRPEDYTEAGWGIVVHEDEDPAVLQNLKPLIEHRSAALNASGRGSRLRILTYSTDETLFDWLTRYKSDPGVVNPDRIPYYLLLAGSPARIPFEFSQDLDVVFCIGRVCFGDPDHYRRYAEAVVRCETTRDSKSLRDAVFFGTKHDADAPTAASARLLVRPLYDSFTAAGCRSQLCLGTDATKARLREVLGGPNAPAFVLTATHGLEFPCGDPSQKSRQGALVCDGWPGPGSIDPAYCFSAADLDPEAKLDGSIVCSFACYAAGTPVEDPFVRDPSTAPQLSPEPFVAALAESLLSLPNGPALAFIGHVGRAWGFSYLTPQSAAVLDCFQLLVGQTLGGKPVGLALDGFNAKYAALSVELETLRKRRLLGALIPDRKFGVTWIARNDAGSYMLMGDPAVRLRPGLMAGSA